MKSRLIHIKRRAEERYGLTLTDKDIADMDCFASQFNTGRAKIAIPFRGTWISVGFKPEIGILTCLPKDTLNSKMKSRALKLLNKLKKGEMKMGATTEHLSGFRARVANSEIPEVLRMHKEGISLESLSKHFCTFPKTIKSILDGSYVRGGGKVNKAKVSPIMDFEAQELQLLSTAKKLITQVENQEKILISQIQALETQREALKKDKNYLKATVLVRNSERFELGVTVA